MQPPGYAKVEVTGSLEETERVGETEHAPLTSEAAVLQATAEGLTLEPTGSTNASGYKGVFVDGVRLQGKRRGSEAKNFNVRVKPELDVLLGSCQCPSAVDCATASSTVSGAGFELVSITELTISRGDASR